MGSWFHVRLIRADGKPRSDDIEWRLGWAELRERVSPAQSSERLANRRLVLDFLGFLVPHSPFRRMICGDEAKMQETRTRALPFHNKNFQVVAVNQIQISSALLFFSPNPHVHRREVSCPPEHVHNKGNNGMEIIRRGLGGKWFPFVSFHIDWRLVHVNLNNFHFSHSEHRYPLFPISVSVLWLLDYIKLTLNSWTPSKEFVSIFTSTEVNVLPNEHEGNWLF